MKAPEKVYRRLEGNYIKYYDYKPAKIRYNEKEPTEYVSKDAFIEKATSYIQQHWIWDTKMIEQFKNYMKGE